MRRDQDLKDFKNNHKKMPKNIYNGKTYSQHVKRFHIVHFIFKYKFLVPLIKIGNFLLKKVLIKKIPKTSENRNIIILDTAYEEALKKWYSYYLRNTGPTNNRPSRKEMLKRSKNEIFLRSMKNYVVTMYLYDTAYREFTNILMHEIAHKMVEEYSKPEYQNKKTGHLLFTTDIYDVNYYILEKELRFNTALRVSDAEQLLKQMEEQNGSKEKDGIQKVK